MYFRSPWNHFWRFMSVLLLNFLNPLLVATTFFISVVISKPTLVALWTSYKLMCLTHFLFHYLTQGFCHFIISGRDFFKGGDCNIPDVKKQLKLWSWASSSISIKCHVINAFHVAFIAFTCCIYSVSHVAWNDVNVMIKVLSDFMYENVLKQLKFCFNKLWSNKFILCTSGKVGHW